MSVGKKTLTVALETLGCKVNQAETEQLTRQLSAAGCRIAAPEQPADIYILNTCTVTHIADRKSRHWLRMVHRRNPHALVVVTGCYAEWAAQELDRIDGISLIVNNKDKPHLVRILQESGILSTIPEGQPGLDPVIEAPCHGISLRTRAFVKVQDGCHNFCTYCIVPLVRSREESLPPDKVIEEIKKRRSDGYKEIVVTGVEVGSYLHGETDLKGLLESILAETDLPRLRLSSLQPNEITPGLIDLWQDSRLCRHFHLSLQNGSDTVLHRMNRRYTAARYVQAVDLIRSRLPEAAITTDIITGFPGETDIEFTESYEFIKKMAFARIHVFPFSPRRGTKAAGFPGRVDEKTKKQRTDRMLKLGEECIRDFSRRFTGRTLPVLFEQQENGLWSGLTDNYIRVFVESGEDLTNQIIPVALGEAWGEGVRGRIRQVGHV